MSGYIGNSAQSNITTGLSTVSQLTISTAASKIIPGATSLSLRNNADSADNLIITNAGAVTIRAGLTVTASGITITAGGIIVTAGDATVTAGNVIITAGNLVFAAASAKLIPGATSFLFRNNADSQTNITITDAGAVSIARSTLTVSGAITPTGGVAAAAGFTMSPKLFHSGGMPARVSTDGTDATPSVTETYVVAVNILANCTVTGVAQMNGSATGSGNITVFLADSTGTVLASSATTAISGTDAYQRVPFSSTYAAKGPATYFIAVQYDNTSTRFNTHVFGDFPAGKITSTVYGTLVSFTAPSTFTTGLGPIASLY